MGSSTTIISGFCSSIKESALNRVHMPNHCLRKTRCIRTWWSSYDLLMCPTGRPGEVWFYLSRTAPNPATLSRPIAFRHKSQAAICIRILRLRYSRPAHGNQGSRVSQGRLVCLTHPRASNWVWGDGLSRRKDADWLVEVLQVVVPVFGRSLFRSSMPHMKYSGTHLVFTREPARYKDLLVSSGAALPYQTAMFSSTLH
jgi:hypothetical protein